VLDSYRAKNEQLKRMLSKETFEGVPEDDEWAELNKYQKMKNQRDEQLVKEKI
jgi:hypothetical protein